MASLKAQTPASHQMDSAAGYAMSQKDAARAYYGALLENPNVQRGLATIKASEGTLQKPDPYASGFGNTTISSFTDHPGISYGFTQTNGKKNRTTAAGAYQFLSKTWKSISKKLGLPDFSPVNQDIAALGLIDQAGALGSLIQGDLTGFVGKVNGIWASLPGAPYAQPTRAWSFVENAWNNALNPNAKVSLPDTAPTPFSPDSQLGDTTPGAPIGHVERAPLGALAPSAPTKSFSGLATPRGIGALAPSTPAAAPAPSPSFSGQATPRGVGTQTAPAPSASLAPSTPSTGFVSQDERASLAERLGIQPSTPALGPVAPSIGAIAPSVATAAPAATVAPAIAAPKISVPAAVPAAPKVAVPAAVSSRPALAAPAQPSISPADVYGGAIGTAQTSTPGTTVSRVNSFGPTYTTNKYGAVTATAADGTQMAVLGGVPASQPSAINGPLGQTAATPEQSTGGLFGPKAKTATGAITGAALGAYALGPLGGLLGGLVGKNLAQGKAPFAGLLGNSGNSLASTHVVDTFDGPVRAMNAVGGLGFPSKPSGPAPGGVAAGMRGLSPGAANAIDHGYAGLY